MDTTVKAPAVSGDQREYLFDNYKVLLILLVVIGHFIEPSNDQNPFLYELKWGIVAFHMPAFIFISGYFSKRIPSLKKMLCGHSLFCIRDSLLSFIHLYTGQRDRLLFYKAEIFPLVSDGTVRLETVVSSD